MLSRGAPFNGGRFEVGSRVCSRHHEESRMRLKTAVALTCAAVLVLGGCSRKSSSTHTLAFITNNASDFWTIARKGTEKADAERADITVEFRLGDGTAAGQKRIGDDLVAKGADGND